MQIVLVDIPDRKLFYPFTLTRSLVELRFGIFTIQERWEKSLDAECAIYTAPYLQTHYQESLFLENNTVALFINATCIPSAQVIKKMMELKEGDKLISDSGKWIASLSKERAIGNILLGEHDPIVFPAAKFINNALHLLQLNAAFIASDFALISKSPTSLHPDIHTKLIHPNQIFIEAGATISCANLNASFGPIYIGKDAVVMEGAAIRGPFAMGAKSVVKMNTAIYGATSIGSHCLVGGEIKNTIIMDYSNKGHEGYLGDSIIGQWCNLGAGTTNSNVKNTGGPVQIWDEFKQEWVTVGQKMGMLVGDYSRFAIQSSINTGSYIGVSANIFGNGLLPKYIPNFSWGVTPGYRLDKAIEDIDNWKKMKGQKIVAAEMEVLKTLFDME